MEQQTETSKYVNLYSELRSKGLSEEVVVVVLQEVGKDGRVERMRSVNGVGQTNGGSNGDQPATAKHIGFLKNLGVRTSPGLTKKQASELIDARLQKRQGSVRRERV